MSELTPTLSVVIPCYNECGALRDTVTQIRTALGDSIGYELILVDDGSKDDTGAIMDQLAEEADGVRALHHSVNRGYGAALKTGVRAASAPYVVITDADGTYPNDRIPELVKLMIEGDYDMVVGARTAEDAKYSWLRSIPKWFLTKYASWITQERIPDINSGLRVFRRELALHYGPILPNGFSFTTTITVAMLTNSQFVRFVPISYSKRVGKSKIRPIRDTVNFVVLIARTGAYFAPLRVILPIGFALGLAFGGSLVMDLVGRDLTERTLLLLLFSLNTSMFALIADMIDKRSEL
jgi:glycosyltransferase involved in cell wall biosynthesis